MSCRHRAGRRTSVVERYVLSGGLRRLRRDIVSDVMWALELEPEVEEWLDGLSVREFALTVAHLDRLAERGNELRMPASRSLGDGLFELRFDIGRVARRVT